MARRKFGQYRVDFKKGRTTTRPDGLIETTGVITGDIEIGIYIDTMTWREDWLAQQMFGDAAREYKLMNIQNTQSGGIPGQKEEVNRVIAVWYHRKG